MSRFYSNSDHVVEPAQDTDAQPSTRGTALAGGEPPAQPRPSFYGNSQHDVKPAGEKAPEPAKPDAVRVPDEVAKLRAENPSIHDPLGTYRGVLSPGTLSAALPAEVGEPVVNEVANILADHELSVPEASEVLQVLKAPAPSDAERSQWQRDSERYLATISDADAQAAVKLLDRDPRVAELLERTGAINNPRVVRLLVDKARALRSRGRL